MKTQHYWKAILCYARIDCICAIWMEGFDSYVSFVLSRHFHPSILSTLRSRVVSNIGSTNSHSTWTRLLIDSGTEGKRGWLFLDPVQRWSRDWLCDRWHCASSKPRSPVCVYVCVCACTCARVCVCVWVMCGDLYRPMAASLSLRTKGGPGQASHRGLLRSTHVRSAEHKCIETQRAVGPLKKPLMRWFLSSLVPRCSAELSLLCWVLI